jgi:hypothetical protein
MGSRDDTHGDFHVRRATFRVVALAVFLGACRAAPAPSAVGPLPGEGTRTEAPATLLTGVLTIAVKWPERPRSGQTIPLSAEAVVVTVSDGSGAQVAMRRIVRSGAVTAETIALPAGTGYAVTGKAYAKADPGPGDVAIASATVAGQTVAWGRQTAIRLDLVPAFGPAIDALSVGSAGPGMALFLSGTNLDREAGKATVVFPSGMEAPGDLVDGKLRVTVPAGAGTGPLRVRVDGVLSGPGAAFRELKSLGVGLTAADADREWPDGAVHTWLGDGFGIGATGVDSAGAPVATAGVSRFENTTPAVGTLASGSYVPAAFGQDVVIAESGQLAATRAIVVGPPAGRTVSLGAADTAAEAGAGLAAGTQGEWLGYWYEAGLNKAGAFQPFTPGSAARGNRVVVPFAFSDVSRRFRIASRGGDGLIALESARNSLIVAAFDPATGGIRKLADGSSSAVRSTFQGVDLVRIQELEQGGPDRPYCLTIALRDADTGAWTHEIWVVDVKPGELPKNLGRTPISASGTLTMPDAEQQGGGLAFDGSRYVYAFNMRTSDKGATLLVPLDLASASLDWDRKQGYTHAVSQMAALASNGSRFLLATVENFVSDSQLKVWLVDPSLAVLSVIGLEALGSRFVDPLGQQVSVVWNGSEFVVGYVKREPGGTLVPRVQRISANGAVLGPPDKVAPSGSSLALGATAEGAVALWIDDAGKPRTRRLKYR